MKSEMNWEMLALRVREAKKSIDSLQAFLEESEGFFRDYDEIDKPIIEPHGDGRRLRTLEYDSVDIAKASARMDIPVLIGMKEDGNPLVVDLSRLPHLLVSGITGSGKTMLLSTMLYGFLKWFTPEEMRLALYDEKCVEFTPWLGSPYLYRPVETDAKKVLEVLKDLDSEMKRRFKILSAAGCRSVQDYNTAPSVLPASKREKLPYIVFVADEVAELMVNEGKRAVPIFFASYGNGPCGGDTSCAGDVASGTECRSRAAQGEHSRTDCFQDGQRHRFTADHQCERSAEPRGTRRPPVYER